MKIKQFAKAALIFGAGVIVGVVGIPLVFWGCEALSFSNTAPMSATASTNQTSEGVTVELGSDAYHGVTIRRNSEQLAISPPPKVIWTKAAVADSANAVYLLAYDEVRQWAYSPRSLVRLELAKASEPLSKYTRTEFLRHSALSNLVGDAFISELDGASSDGKRLLVRIGLRKPIGSYGYSFAVANKAYYYYPIEGKLDEISP